MMGKNDKKRGQMVLSDAFCPVLTVYIKKSIM